MALAGKEWKYSTGTEAAAREALLELLKAKPLSEIGVSELAHEAGISRSTFYAHFKSPVDVYETLVDELSRDLSPIMEQVTCSRDGARAGKPFCAFVRGDDRLSSVIADERFLRDFLAKGQNVEGHDLFGLLVNAGYDKVQARAICTFQLAGCFYAARAGSNEREWEQSKEALDRFILGGVAACLATKKREEEQLAKSAQAPLRAEK